MSTNRLREFRQRRGLTTRQLADRVGSTQSVIAMLELGHRSLSSQWAVRLAEALDVQADELYGASANSALATKTPRPSHIWLFSPEWWESVITAGACWRAAKAQPQNKAKWEATARDHSDEAASTLKDELDKWS